MDAFISYRRKPSSTLALFIQKSLNNDFDIDAYVDTTRTDSTKVQFPDRLMQAIADAPVFVCLLGEGTLDSEWVLKEIEEAYRLKKRCLPVFQESYKPLDNPSEAVNYLLSFDGVHVMDVKNIYVEEAVQQIASLIKQPKPKAAYRMPLVITASLVMLVIVLGMFTLPSILQNLSPTEGTEVAQNTPLSAEDRAATGRADAYASLTALFPTLTSTATEDSAATAQAQVFATVTGEYELTQASLILTAAAQAYAFQTATRDYQLRQTSQSLTATANRPTATLNPTNRPTNTQSSLQVPVADFTAPSTAMVNSDVQFINTSTGEISTYYWDFNGDSYVDSVEVDPIYRYSSTGQYTVILTVSNDSGSNSVSAVIDVQAPAPQVNITGEFAFVSDRDGNNEIYVVNADGSNPVNVTSNGADDTEPAWSPDGTKLAFSSNRQGDYDLFILELSSGIFTQVTFDTSDDTEPAWSPGGNRLAYTRISGGSGDIYFVNLSDNSTSSWLATDAHEFNPEWSPDGSQIVYESLNTDNIEIFVANVNDVNTSRNIGNNDSQNAFPSWSIDNRIVFASTLDGVDWEIYTINPDGSGIQKLTNNNVFDSQPNWYPDGSHLVYTCSSEAGTRDICVMRADGSEQAPFTTNYSNEFYGVRR